MSLRVKGRRARLVVGICTIFLPWALKRRLLNRLLGYDLARDAKIGMSIVAVEKARMDSGARIGHLTVCRGLERLDIGTEGRIGNLNWIAGGGERLLDSGVDGRKTASCLLVGTHSAITNRHYIDCSDSVDIGEFTIVAGVRSQILTHSVDTGECRQLAKSVVIGDYCFIGTGSILLPGAVLPAFSILAAGSVLRKPMEHTWMLYAGVPAVPKKQIPKSHKYFVRTKGYI